MIETIRYPPRRPALRNFVSMRMMKATNPLKKVGNDGRLFWRTLFLAVVSFAGMVVFPGLAGASTTDPSTGLVYDVTNSQATISGCVSPCTTTTALTIPATLGGYPVVAIADLAFTSSIAATSLTTPASLTAIGVGAFYGATALTTVDLPNVTSIGNQAFMADHLLTSVTFPRVTNIGVQAFLGDYALSAIAFPDTLVTIGDVAFGQDTALANVVFLGNAPSIGTNAFQQVPAVEASYFADATGWTPWPLAMTPITAGVLIAPPIFVNAAPIAGTPSVGSTLSVPTVGWTSTYGVEVQTGYYWMSCTSPVISDTAGQASNCTLINGGDSPIYTVTSDQAGKYIAVLVGGFDGHNSASVETIPSVAIAASPTPDPVPTPKEPAVAVTALAATGSPLLLFGQGSALAFFGGGAMLLVAFHRRRVSQNR
jgi:BspA type Leucine rich repeat region (6 copies)